MELAQEPLARPLRVQWTSSVCSLSTGYRVPLSDLLMQSAAHLLRVAHQQARIRSLCIAAAACRGSTAYSSSKLQSIAMRANLPVQRRFASDTVASAAPWKPPPRPTPGQNGYETVSKIRNVVCEREAIGVSGLCNAITRCGVTL